MTKQMLVMESGEEFLTLDKEGVPRRWLVGDDGVVRNTTPVFRGIQGPKETGVDEDWVGGTPRRPQHTGVDPHETPQEHYGPPSRPARVGRPIRDNPQA